MCWMNLLAQEPFVVIFTTLGFTALLESANPLSRMPIAPNALHGAKKEKPGITNGKKLFGATNRASFYFRMMLTRGSGVGQKKNTQLIALFQPLSMEVAVSWYGVVLLITSQGPWL